MTGLTAANAAPQRRPGAAVLGRISAAVAPGEGWAMLLGGVLVVVSIAGFFVFAEATNSDTWVPVLVVVNLLLISVPICMWLAGQPRDRRLYYWLLLLLVMKLFMAGPRYVVNQTYYDGAADAGRYYQAGAFLVENIQDGRWSTEPAELNSFPKETRVVGYLVGMLYLVFGATYFGGFLIFSWLSWIGLMLFFRAYRIAYPNAPPYLLVKLMFLPSLLFWPSSLGKEALMVFLIGLVTLGAARVLSGSKVVLGAVWIALGGVAMLQIRPHLLLITALALGLSTLATSNTNTATRGILARVLVVAMVLPLLVLGVGRMDQVFGTQGEAITTSLDQTVDRTEIGGSAFETRPVRGPQDLPNAALTVLYRPFIFEASSLAAQIAAFEGMMLMGLTVLAARWIWRIGPVMFRSPFAAYCGAWVLGFIVAFSNIGNAGILARQRVQMFPLLILLAMAAYQHADGFPSDESLLSERDAKRHRAVGKDGLGVVSLPESAVV